MRLLTLLAPIVAATLGLAPAAPAADPSWPKEITFALLSTESAPGITRRWALVVRELSWPQAVILA